MSFVSVFQPITRTSSSTLESAMIPFALTAQQMRIWTTMLDSTRTLDITQCNVNKNKHRVMLSVFKSLGSESPSCPGLQGARRNPQISLRNRPSSYHLIYLPYEQGEACMLRMASKAIGHGNREPTEHPPRPCDTHDSGKRQDSSHPHILCSCPKLRLSCRLGIVQWRWDEDSCETVKYKSTCITLQL